MKERTVRLCRKCGARLDSKTGLCPRCDAEQYENRMQPKIRTKKRSLRRRRRRIKKIIMILIILVILVIAGIFIAGRFLPVHEEIHYSQEEIEDIADTYAEKNGTDGLEPQETVALTDIDAYTESEALTFLESRGFTDYEVYAEYTMDGEYVSGFTAGSDPDMEHPLYYTYYANSYGDVYTVYLVGNELFAYPVVYNSENEAELWVTESDSVTVYDEENNQYLTYAPDDEALSVYQLDRLDAYALGAITVND